MTVDELPRQLELFVERCPPGSTPVGVWIRAFFASAFSTPSTATAFIVRRRLQRGRLLRAGVVALGLP